MSGGARLLHSNQESRGALPEVFSFYRDFRNLPRFLGDVMALALIGKFPAEEQSANLRRLKEILETGSVTDTSYSVPGKFVRP